jgi:outer membrane protein
MEPQKNFKHMKANISLALNAILFLAVAYLFTQLSSDKPAQSATPSTELSSEVPSIVYINADSLLENFSYFKDKINKLKEQETDATNRINQQMGALEAEFKAVQKKIQQGLLAPNQIAAEEQRLGRKQQTLLAEQEQLSQQLLRQTQQVNAELQDELITLMDKLREEKGYDYILQYGQGSSVLSAANNNDITLDVLNLLNAAHSEERTSDGQ